MISRCAECAHWRRPLHPDSDKVEEQHGDCRRRAPVIVGEVIASLRMVGGLGDGGLPDQADVVGATIWPRTFGGTGCGEFESAPTREG